MSDTSTAAEASPGRAQRLKARVISEWQSIAGGVGVFVVAVVLYSRFTINGVLVRDEAIYVYGAQRFSHGVAPYASIFDPKTPGATIIGGFAAAFAHLVGANDLHAIRVAFFVLSVLTAVAVYLLALQLWHSIPGAVAAGVAFTSFAKFGHDALVGPDAKTPGVLFLVLSMYLIVRRRWFLGALLAGCAFEVWQPLLWFGLIAIVAAAVNTESGRRLRAAGIALAGAALPTVVLALYFLIAGAFSDFVDAAVIYPLTGTTRPKETLGEHFGRIVHVIDHHPMTGALVWTGTALLVALVVMLFLGGDGDRRAALRSPLFLIVFVTFVLNILYAIYDFQSDPDTLPFLPYPALGIGGAVALLIAVAKGPLARRVAITTVCVGTVAVTVAAFVTFTKEHDNKPGLRDQLTSACAVSRLATGDVRLVTLGSPLVLALLHRTSPTKYIYLSAGVDRWKIDHTRGGLAAWEQEVISEPSVIVFNGWRGKIAKKMRKFLKSQGYRRHFVGRVALYLNPQMKQEAKQAGLALTARPTPRAFGIDGAPLPARVPCENA